MTHRLCQPATFPTVSYFLSRPEQGLLAAAPVHHPHVSDKLPLAARSENTNLWAFDVGGGGMCSFH